ncbi:dynactin subunit 2 isoform X1 [Neodiprion lecontei]|uniref:Dynactin subunit 2 isoform X1 n=1 Tax=Neodiprion lecontei TaxID=441921 RepID=A0ABM3GBX5_NEOLC|nr:dynactin subunit 2 isoform X1 [Neodiprion lecontei]
MRNPCPMLSRTNNYTAYDQPDVYETNDLPESDQFQNYSEEENDSIERLHISATEAFNKFKGKHLINKGVDFSDQLSRKPRTGYNAISGVWELPGEGGTETPIQKYQRLQCEIKELYDEVNQIKESAKNDGDVKSAVELASQVEQTGKQLDNLKLEQCLGSDLVNSLTDPHGTQLQKLISQVELFKVSGTGKPENSTSSNKAEKEGDLQPGVLQYQMLYQPERARLQEASRVAHLEQRLGRLENVIGTGNEKLSRLSQSIKTQGLVEAVQQLGAKAALLDATQLDGIESRLATLVHRMDNIAQQKASAPISSDQEQKISEIYEVIKKTETMSQILPQTVNRMLALSTVHQQAAEFSRSLALLEELQGQISSGIESNKVMLKGVQESFASNLEAIKNNITAIDERVKKLNK